MTPKQLQKWERRVGHLAFIRDKLNEATSANSPDGFTRLPPKEAIEFIARHVLPPGPDDKFRRCAILRILMTSHRRIEWTPAVFEALTNVVVPLREVPLQSMMMCAESAFKLSSDEVVSAIRNEAALDPKRRAIFDTMKAGDRSKNYYVMLKATPGVSRACARYLNRALAKQCAKPSGPT